MRSKRRRLILPWLSLCLFLLLPALLVFTGNSRALARTIFDVNIPGFRNLVTTNEWGIAAGLHRNRMFATNAQTLYPLYRTLWQRTNDQVMVCLQYPGVESFGTPYDVAIYDSKLQVIRRGNITAYQDDTPYCLAEVKSDDSNLPAELRGQWLLAAGFWENRYQESMRLHERKTNTAEMIQAEITKLPFEFYFELVRWEDAKVKPKLGTGNLRHLNDLQIRWIEVGSNVLAHARPEARASSRYSIPKELLPHERTKVISPPVFLKIE